MTEDPAIPTDESTKPFMTISAIRKHDYRELNIAVVQPWWGDDVYANRRNDV